MKTYPKATVLRLYLWPIVLDVVVDLLERLNRPQGRQEGERLRRRAPVGLWVPDVDEDVEEQDDDVGGDGCPVVHEEHDGQAEEGSDEGQPTVGVLESWPPSG